MKQTAQLPEIELTKPKVCVRSRYRFLYDFWYGLRISRMVEGFIDRINEEVKDNCFVIATGGVSRLPTINQ